MSGMYVMSGKPSVTIRIYNNKRKQAPIVIDIYGDNEPKDVERFIKDALAREGAKIQ